MEGGARGNGGNGGGGGHRLLVAAVAIATTVAIVGCGGADPPDAREQAAAAVGEFQRLVLAGDRRAACAQLSDAGRARVRRIGRRPCADSLAALARRAMSKPPAVRSVRIDRDRAVATVGLGPGPLRAHLPLVREHERWKLDDVVVEPLWPAGWAARAPELGYGAWAETQSGPRPCPRSRGGLRACPTRLPGAATDIQLLTAFGDVQVARCRFGYRLYAGDRVFTADRVRFDGPGDCGRIDHCVDGETGLRYPWLGNALRMPDPTVVAVFLDVCVNTPAGRVRGFLFTRFTRRDGDWRAATYDAPVGPSGFQMVGRWDVAPDDFDIGDTSDVPAAD